MRIKNYKYILSVLSLLLLSVGFLYAQGSDLQSHTSDIELSGQDYEKNDTAIDSLASEQYLSPIDSILNRSVSDTLALDSTANKSFLDDIMSGQNKDSLVYDVKTGVVSIYEQGDVSYQNMNIKADYMRVDMNTKEIFAYGRMDTVKMENTRPEFKEGSSLYTMDTLNYNINSKKAKIKGVSTKEGDGILDGVAVKKMDDNSINISKGKYTTCNADHPHFYIAMTKAKLLTGEKVVVGPSYMVFEDVPLYFLGLPFGFFPLDPDRSSGFIMPEYGEENARGFFVRDGGYYLVINDYVDLTATAGYYTYGSWDGALSSKYSKRYRYNGSVSLDFAKYITGEKGSEDYTNMNNFSVKWTHSQDAKFKPNSTFAASVDFSTSGYGKYGSTTLEDYLTTQTNSSISYSKKWDNSPFSLSTNLQHSQNSTDTTVSLSLPNLVVSMSRIAPFERKNAVGAERWYEKIYLSYTANMSNTVTVHEDDLFTQTMMNDMKSGVKHSIPISTSFSLFNYINMTPSLSYTERWYFRKITKEWDEEEAAVVVADTTNGFYRLYDYNVSLSASTSIYGMYTVKNSNAWLKAVRHMMTPTVSMSYRPNFGKEKYGYYETIQSSTSGSTTTYSPFSTGLYGVPSNGESASLSFSLANTLEMKVRSYKDTSGVKKIKLIENLSFSGSYNFLADSMNLSTISTSFRTTITTGVSLNVSATIDPYVVNSSGTRLDKFMLVEEGKLGRISTASTSFSYSLNSKSKSKTNSNNTQAGSALNDISTQKAQVPLFTDGMIDPTTLENLEMNERLMKLASSYYDFSIPWNLGLSYSFSYTNSGVSKNVYQTLSFSGSVSPTTKWGISFNAGYDFEMNTLTPGTFSLSRDLHCWQMSFSWVPIGYMQSWSFSIKAKSQLLQDLKYDKSHSYYDNLYDY